MVTVNGTQIKDRLSQAAITGTNLDVSAARPAMHDLDAADLRSALLVPPAPGAPVRELWVTGAHVRGKLDLRGCTVPRGARFVRCEFEQGLQLAQATMMSLRIEGGRVPGIDATQLTLSGDLCFTEGFRADGTVTLAGAHINGSLECSEAQFVGDGDIALDCERAVIGETLKLGPATRLQGALVLYNARIQGNLECSARLQHPASRAVQANLLTVAGDVLFHEGFVCAGTLDLNGASITGRLHIGRGSITKGSDRSAAILGEGIRVTQSIDIDEGVTVDGSIRLPYARVDTQISIRGATVRNGGRQAVNGEGAVVKGDVYLTENTRVIGGAVDFIGAQVSADFVCDAEITGSGGYALLLQRATVGGSAILEEMHATGEVRMLGTKVGLDLKLGGATLHNPGGWALHGNGASIGKDALLNRGFTCIGTIDLIRVHIMGSLCLDDATLRCPGGTALDLCGGRMGVLQLQMRTAPVGVLRLLDAHADVLIDSAATWPQTIDLEGFDYTVLDPSSPADVRSRLQWLARNQRGYSSRIYEPLIRVLQAAGNDDDARQVQLEREAARMRNSPPRVRWLYRLFGVTVGYGYAARRILPWLAGLLAVGTVVFWATYGNEFRPKDPNLRQTFNPFFYTLDLLIPVASLGLRGSWVTSGVAMYLTWIFTIFGWLLAAVLVAGVSQMVRKH
jgi:hypothetical protein